MDQVREAQAIKAMDDMARKIGVTGVAIVMAVPFFMGNTSLHHDLQPRIRIIGRHERPPQPESRGPADKGTNFLAVAFSKVAEMLSTHEGSGTTNRVAPTGEFGYRGGLTEIRGDIMYFAAFSGSTPEVDVAIAKVGLDTLLAQG